MGREDKKNRNLTKASLIYFSIVPLKLLKAFVLKRNPVYQQIRNLPNKVTVCDALASKDDLISLIAYQDDAELR